MLRKPSKHKRAPQHQIRRDSIRSAGEPSNGKVSHKWRFFGLGDLFKTKSSKSLLRTSESQAVSEQSVPTVWASVPHSLASAPIAQEEVSSPI
ncbi:hypothetical protein AAVH_05990 [Aphelenchoides avenae]|nr:hypothetical protein AAVH_05990 [Aphelenchus avenae]